jgi:hypothetical protein
MHDQPSPCRRFQFRLRTLMIGVALLAVPLLLLWLSHQAVIARERIDLLLLVLIRGGGYEFVDPADQSYKSIGTCGIDLKGWRLVRSGDISGQPWRIRGWLGDCKVESIWLTAAVSPDDVIRIAAAFPESTVAQDAR